MKTRIYSTPAVKGLKVSKTNNNKNIIIFHILAIPSTPQNEIENAQTIVGLISNAVLSAMLQRRPNPLIELSTEIVSML